MSWKSFEEGLKPARQKDMVMVPHFVKNWLGNGGRRNELSLPSESR
jgi:hypothetical protein